ncbi:hypothetical protein [Caballeronia sp. LZ032]|uniref:hypothetical protein n=1 Tax=Caballeronia sp. LZ032 TaxID=3038565 RepID=UPI0028562797|nr:hypothetical protein [Caballeronia sp. LZ032]MDR5881145.1 hypothetical protein [Caballeronia sp. LZ032]
MYKAGAYFVECVPEQKAYGWHCILHFSRINDYQHSGEIPRTSLVSPIIAGSSLAVEYESVRWAREYVEKHRDELELALSR